MSSAYTINKSDIKEYIESTSATPTIRGFHYQFLITISKWIDLHNKYLESNEKYKIYCEDEDDIKIEDSKKTKYIQVKAYKENITPTSEALIKSIFNFYLLNCKYKDENRDNEYILETNTSIGTKSLKLKAWIEKKLTKEEQNDLFSDIKLNVEKFLEKKKKFKKCKIDDDEFYKFMYLITLEFKNESIDQCIQKETNRINEKINSGKNINIGASILLPRLLQEVVECSSCEGERILDEKMLEGILNTQKEIIAKDTDNRYMKRLEEIKSDVGTIKKDVKDTKSIVEENNIYVKETHECVKQICEDRNKLEYKKTIIKVRSIKNNDSKSNLNLNEFFINDSYFPRKLKNSINWNNQIIEKINAFFKTLISNNMEKPILIDLYGTHTSIAFYIGHMQSKKFSRKIYPINEGKIYSPEKHNMKSDNEFIKTSLEKNNGEEIAIIVNTTIQNSPIKPLEGVSKFIDDSNLKVKELINIKLQKCSEETVNKNNIRDLANQLSEYIYDYKETIHLFFIGPNELAFLLGSKLDKKNNIILYEYTDYNEESKEDGKKLYTQSIKLGIKER